MCLGRLTIAVLLVVPLLAGGAATQEEHGKVRIPRVTRAPTLQDFLSGTPREAEVTLSNFRQFEPGDGTPSSQPTTAYLSYDERNLYVVFVCRDEPGKVRGRLSKREDIESDDTVVVNLDTFHDHQRAYNFKSNPLGVQRDEIFTEGQGADASFDTLWYSDGRRTDDGYVVWMAIPFKSLRFPRAAAQEWGIGLGRSISRNNEFVTWPYITQRRESYLAQLATLEGLEEISPGRNLQFIPYFVASRSRFLDQSAPAPATFGHDTEARPGLDTKLVLRDALTFDLTLNPDFSQVESDEPQVTVNQRFEVYFPEKRPFFIENAGYFQTPINLFFSRRIAEPQFGARVTGKLGRWALGVFAIDDRAQGEQLPAADSLHDERAAVAVARVQREFSGQSTLGALVTSRDFAGSSNRVFSLDTRLRLDPNWVLTAQAARSYTRDLDATHRDGSAYWAELGHTGRHTVYAARYSDLSPDFRTDLGFVPRVDVRQMEHYFRYYWRPENSRVVLFGPDLTTTFNWNRLGQLQDWIVDLSFGADLRGPTGLGCRHVNAFELFQGLGFRRYFTDCGLNTKWLGWLELTLDYGSGRKIAYYPAPGLLPYLGDAAAANAGFTLRPSPRFSLAETYFYTRLRTRQVLAGLPAGTTAFTNHLLRTKVNYQFTRALSLRLILDYNATLPNERLVDLNRLCLTCGVNLTTKRLTGDVLVTYLLNPGTAVYVGYSDRYENLADPALPLEQQLAGAPTVSTGRQVFVKLSYLLRF